MRRTPAIAFLIALALLTGQLASALHAVEHFSTQNADTSAPVLTLHADHHHVNDFSSADAPHTSGEENSELFCLVYHLHGSAQVALPAPIGVLVQHSVVKVDSAVPEPVSITSIARSFSIRGPPAIS